MNCARGLLCEFGFTFPTGAATLPDHIQGLIEDADAPVPMALRDVLHEFVLEIAELESRIETVEKHLETPTIPLARKNRFDTCTAPFEHLIRCHPC